MHIRKDGCEDIISALAWQFNQNPIQLTMSLLTTQSIGVGWRNYTFIFLWHDINKLLLGAHAIIR